MADLSQIRVSGTLYDIKDATARMAVGAPSVAATVSAMTDQSKVYVYTGSETGYTSGDWYYYDGSAWVSGGVYQSSGVETDTTLSVSGAPADAKTTGDSIKYIVSVGDTPPSQHTQLLFSESTTELDLVTTETFNNEISDLRSQISGGVLTAEIKSALMNCINYVAWKNNDPNASQYISALQNALYPPANLSSISAVFTQGSAVIYDTDSLETLKQYLVVTAHYSDSTSETVTTYTLSGTLTVGTSTVTVSYGGKTTTFTVTVTKQIPPTYYFAVDQSKVVSGYIDDSGQHVDGSNYHYVDEKYAGFAWMPVTSALAKDAKALRYAWYDENQDFISRSYGSNLSYVSDASAYYFIAGWSGTSAFSYILAIGNMNDSLFVNEGYLIQTTDGQLVVDSTSVATDFIAVGDASMYLCASVDGTTLRMAFYDSSKTYISSASTNTSANRTPTAIPSNAAYFRISKPTNGICGYPIIEEL